MVGVCANDAGAARAAGVPVILVSFSHTHTPVIEIDTDAVIDTFAELLEAIQQMIQTH